MIIPEKYKATLDEYLQETPVRLGALADALGLEVFKSTLRPEESGLIEPSDTAASGYRIKINRHEMVERQRFTLAHEIAHFLLHRQDIGGGLFDDVLYRSSLSDRKEVEANKLASLIIMPDASVRKARPKVAHLPVDEQIAELSKLFRVSQQAMRIKLGV
ncbi:ImmA/IrrE family metallo-endopeptidase [Sphingomonas sp. ZB1N12]|uniref:ImmA/IrrE family metallo-endopeptidase n=1 Tax=Sphingomonas arabinosi TaxID=3096160 RepID=UPI002FC7EF67